MVSFAGGAVVSDTSEDQVRDVIRNFNADGFDSLHPKYAGGALKAAAGQRIATGVFRQLVLARIIEPASKIDRFEPTQAGNVGSAACAS